MSEIDIVGLAVDGLKRSIAADEAADTIATLTAERDDARAIVAKQAAEVGIWRDKEDNPDRFVAYVELAEERIGFLKARTARLEEALRRIGAIDFDADGSSDAYHAVEVAQQIARQALAQEAQP